LGRTLITGINGYIGSNLGRRLLREGGSVIGCDLESGNIGDLKADSRFEFHGADITSAGAMRDVARDVDHVVHCAALVHKRSTDLSRENYFRINRTGTINILRALNPVRVKRIVLLSTVSVYGKLREGTVPDEGTEPDPDDHYGESKAAAENDVRAYSRDSGVAHTILRLAPVYGTSFLLNIHKRVYLPGEAAFYRIGSGTQRLSLCSVNNVIDVVAAGASHPSFANETFNVSDAGEYSINDIISFFRKFRSQEKKVIIGIPYAFPRLIFKALSLIMPGRGQSYTYQLQKVALDARYSVEKLRKTGVPLVWDLRSTFSRETISGGSEGG
jgi:nucleoside-diphosphate-sugar epimerase